MERIHRIYQGRVTRMEWLGADGFPSETGETGDLMALWGHHVLFQQAVNYYLLALASLESRPGAPLAALRARMAEVWEDGPDRMGERQPGFGKLLQEPLQWLTGRPVPTLAAAFEALGAGRGAPPSAREAALDLLLARSVGEKGIQREGRKFFPLFCDPQTTATWPLDPASFAAGDGFSKLREGLLAEPHQTDLEILAATMTLEWSGVKVVPGQPYGLADARHRLRQALAYLEESSELDPKLRELVLARRGEWEQVKETIAALEAERLRVVRNRKANRDRTFSALLFMHAPCRLTRDLLALIMQKPMTLATRASQAEDLDAPTEEAGAALDPEALLSAAVRVAQDLGEDPIKVARGERGYVFPAFTALAPWQPPAEGVPVWKEFDIAAYKEALKTLNQMRLKVAERLEGRIEARKLLAWMKGEARDLSGTRFSGEAAGDPPGVLLGDPRYERLRALLQELSAEQGPLRGAGATVRPRDVAALERLRAPWERVLLQNRVEDPALAAESLLDKLRVYQRRRGEGPGSAPLLEALCLPENWLIWREPPAEEAPLHAERGWSDDLLRDYLLMMETEQEVRRLSQPIRFTPADPRRSRRPFFFSDVAGAHGARFQGGHQALDVSLAVLGAGRVRLRRARLHFSAPRLLWDELLPAVCKEALGSWMPPLVRALALAQAEHPRLIRAPAAALMPDLGENGQVRVLLNFPVTLDVASLNRRMNGGERWSRSFNASGKALLHLHWPGTLNPRQHEQAWWREARPFHVLGVELGPHRAAAVALLRVHSEAEGKGTWRLGQAGGIDWRASLRATRLLRLPGEGAREWVGRQLRQELSGSKGRPAEPAETEEARRLCQALDWDPGPLEGASFPRQNDWLLTAFRGAQKGLAEAHRWAWMLRHPERRSRALQELSDREDRTEWRDLARSNRGMELLVRIDAENQRVRDQLPRLLGRVADWILPLKQKGWVWQSHPNCPQSWILSPRSQGGQPTPPRCRGQRGLSLAHLEQLEELRRRCQSLNRLLLQSPTEKPGERPALRNRPVPNPCPEMLRRLEQLRTDRVNQTAHLILVEALGLRLKRGITSAAGAGQRLARRPEHRHGSYEVIPGRVPVDLVVLEDLSRYLAHQGRASGETGHLMQWCHRAILEKVKLLMEAFGIPVLETPGGYASSFCSRSGVAGFRAREITLQEARGLLGSGPRSSEPSEEGIGAALVQTVCEQLERAEAGRAGTSAQRPPRALLLPAAGGPLFVPGSAATLDGEGRDDQGRPVHTTQADLNAAINLALRALAGPDAWALRNRLRVDRNGGGWTMTRTNKFELARFPEVTPVEWVGPEGKPSSGQRMNLFVDLGPLASGELVRVQGRPDLPRLATGRGLWQAVQTLKAEAIQRLNAQRLRQWGLETAKQPFGTLTLAEE